MHRLDNGRVLIGVADAHDMSVDAVVHRVDPRADARLADKAGPDYAEARAIAGPIRGPEPHVTGGFDLAARHILHLGLTGEELPEELEDRFERCLRAAFDRGALSVAIPALGGPGGVPVHALTAAIAAFVELHPAMERIILCCADEGQAALFAAVASEYF